MTHRTARNILARPMAARAGDVELHTPARLFDRSLTVTLRTLSRSFNESIAVTVSANIAPCDVEFHHSAANRCPERDVDLIFKIAARLWAFVDRLATAAARKNARENIAKPAAGVARRLSPAGARAFEKIRKIKAAK